MQMKVAFLLKFGHIDVWLFKEYAVFFSKKAYHYYKIANSLNSPVW